MDDDDHDHDDHDLQDYYCDEIFRRRDIPTRSILLSLAHPSCLKLIIEY